MMDSPHSMIPRTLTCDAQHETLTLRQPDLLARPESLVILGEAGMGKTALTTWLASQDGVKRCTARQLLNRGDPTSLVKRGELLVIDALDEAAARREGDAVDLVLRALEKFGYPRFILTCRVADWRSATGRAAIAEQYAVPPMELRLQPFSLEDAETFLAARLGPDRAADLVALYTSRKLADLLGNPQTLTMLAEVAGRENPPASVGALFERYIDIAWFEHSDQHADSVLEELGRDRILDALGGAYAALLLSGGDSLSRAPRSQLTAGDIALADVAALPDAGDIKDALRSRLASSAGPERFTWPHKRIAEYLGARWLARQADSPRKRRRLLALFHDRGLVPASLRGLHAWLMSHGPDLAPDIIASDPMGLVEYGDADRLTPVQAIALLSALERLALEDPWFLSRGDHPAQGLVQSRSIEPVRRIIRARDAPVRLRLLLLEQLATSPHAPAFSAELHAILLDPADGFILRHAAAFALAGFIPPADWQLIVEQLRLEATEDSCRLGLDIADHVGYDLFSDELLAALIITLALVDSNVVGLFWKVERDLPDARLDEMLDALAAAVAAWGDPDQTVRDHEIIGLAYAWMARRVAARDIAPQRLWSWLEPLGDRATYQRDGQQALAQLLAANDELRRAVQWHVLFEQQDEETVFARGCSLADRSDGLSFTPADVCAHLARLGVPTDPDEPAVEAWRDLVQLSRHRDGEGADVRSAAMPFALAKQDLVGWLEDLPKPRIYPAQIRRDERQQKAREEREARWANDRDEFGAHIDAMRAGAFSWLSGPAKAYLKVWVRFDTDRPAQERVAFWLGEDLAEAAHQGFEAFLTMGPPYPSAQDIAASHAESKNGWNAGYILIAALAERVRNGRDFKDLSDERLMAGLFALQNSPCDKHAGIDGVRGALLAEIDARELRETSVRDWIEPQLGAGQVHVSTLYSLLHDEQDRDFAPRLAAEWLEVFPKLAAGVESELVDCLIRADRREELRRIASGRCAEGQLLREQSLSWDAIDMWLGFDDFASRSAAGAPIDPELLWYLRARLGGGRWAGENDTPVFLSPRQLAWIIRSFRTLWPAAYMPSGGSEGSKNAWDAADFLRGVIGRLGSVSGAEAAALLADLCEAPADGYTEYLRNAAAEQRRKQVEECYAPIDLAHISAVLGDDAPRTASDLQAVVIEELGVLARRLAPGGDNANPITGFYSGTAPKGEEDCRDHLLTLLRGQLQFSILAEPEGQAADSKANDIGCSLGPSLMVPVEIKGQWHSALWHAADTQLDRLYASDWRAERRGIYLVLWFGVRGKKLTRPPRGIPLPASAEDLRDALVAKSAAARSGLVDIVVLNLSR